MKAVADTPQSEEETRVAKGANHSRVHTFLERRTVGLLVEPRDGKTPPYIFTAFVVELDDNWFLVTAAHCATGIEKDLAQFPNAALALITFNGTTTRRIELPRTIWKYINFQEKAAQFAAEHEDAEITENDVRLFDLAIFHVPGYYHCTMVNAKVEAFHESDVLFDPSEVGRKILASNDNSMAFAGVPDASYEHDLEAKVTRADFKVFPLHPWPDDELPEDRQRQAYNDKQFTWIPTSWPSGQWDESIRGCSGGPAVIRCGDEVFLLGVVAFEKRATRHPNYVGVVNAYGVFEGIKASLNKP